MAKWHEKFPPHLHDVLQKVFKNDFFEYVDVFDLVEDCSSNKNNIGTVTLNIKNKTPFLCACKIDNNACKTSYLKHDSCADKVIIELLENGQYDIHIFEVAKTRENKLKKLNLQFEGAYLRTLSFLSFFADILQKGNVYFYLVFERTKDPLCMRNPVTNVPLEKYKKHSLSFTDSLLSEITYTDIHIGVINEVTLSEIKNAQ